MIQESIKAKGLVSFILTDENGKVKQQEDRNLVVDSGLAFIASRIAGTASAVMSHIAVGTSSTPATDAQSTLIAEAARVALTSTTIVTTSVADDSVQYVATLAPGIGSVGITEAGLLNAASDGVMFARTVFAVINKGPLDTLTITWKITVA